MQICIFEDDNFKNFYPLSYVRPIFDFRVGVFRLGKRIERIFSENPCFYISRPYLRPSLRERGLNVITVDSLPWGEEDQILFINGALIQVYELRNALADFQDKNFVLVNQNKIIAAKVSGELAAKVAYFLQENNAKELVDVISKHLYFREVNWRTIEYPWDLITNNTYFIEEDFQQIIRNFPNNLDKVDDRSVLLNQQHIFIDKDVRIDSNVVLDARDGPIIVMSGAVVEPFSYIKGPSVIGQSSQILGAQIRSGTSIGPVCRIGGEVEESVFQGYTNKYHSGFIGHSYLGEWVNIGAMATNSDLKNTYTSIKVSINGHVLNSNINKLGVFISDHVKIGIGTLLNAGTIIGIGSNIFGGIAPKNIPSFVWGAGSEFTEYQVDKLLLTIGVSMSRRDKILTSSGENLIRHIFFMTRRDRHKIF